MSIINRYILNLDLKRRYTSDVPTFRRGDTSELIFRLFDEGVEFNINSATSAKVFLSNPSNINLQSDCEFDVINGKRVIKYTLEDIVMVELGYLTVLLVVYEGDSVISIQPFNVEITDDLQGRAGSYLELIQEILVKINEASEELNDSVLAIEKGIPNGVATLDENLKIKIEQLPSEFMSLFMHPTKKVYEEDVHGLIINEDGILQHRTSDGYVNTLTGRGNIEPEPPTPPLPPPPIPIVISNGIGDFDIPSPYQGRYFQPLRFDKGDKSFNQVNRDGFSFANLTRFLADEAGIYTFAYQDLTNGYFYTHKYSVIPSQARTNPHGVLISNDAKQVTVTLPNGYSLRKWSDGIFDVSDFRSRGNEFNQTNTFTAEYSGVYSIYFNDANDTELVFNFLIKIT